ncbi:unnamed protein product [Closterium sp. NIES-53]
MAARTSPHDARRCEERKCRDQLPQTSHAQRTTHKAAGPTGSQGNAAAAGAGYHQRLHAARLHLDQHHRRRHLHHHHRCLHRRCRCLHNPHCRHRSPHSRHHPHLHCHPLRLLHRLHRRPHHPLHRPHPGQRLWQRQQGQGQGTAA